MDASVVHSPAAAGFVGSAPTITRRSGELAKVPVPSSVTHARRGRGRQPARNESTSAAKPRTTSVAPHETPPRGRVGTPPAQPAMRGGGFASARSEQRARESPEARRPPTGLVRVATTAARTGAALGVQPQPIPELGVSRLELCDVWIHGTTVRCGSCDEIGGPAGIDPGRPRPNRPVRRGVGAALVPLSSAASSARE